MPITYIHGQVKGTRGKQADVKFLVDSGATYTVLPETVWDHLGIKAHRAMSFTLPDGTTVDQFVSEIHLTLPLGQAHTPVVLGERSDTARLGTVTLEILGFVFDPVERTFQPMRAFLT